MGRELAIEQLGRVPYARALELQRRYLEERRAGAAPDRLLLLEHPPVITLGRRSRPEHLRVPPELLAQRGIELHEVPRGGDVTYHGPGQLVGYLIVDLAARGERDVHAFLRAIEQVLGEALGELGVRARCIPGLTGVFAAPGPDEPRGARPRKLASIGVGVRGWVTWHGFALNVDLDPGDFSAIVPCGLAQVDMTSVAAELGAGLRAGLAQRARSSVAAACARRWS